MRHYVQFTKGYGRLTFHKILPRNILSVLAPQVNLDLQIQIDRSTFHQASVLISTNPQAAPANRKWKISVQKTEPAYSLYTPVQEYVEWATGSSQKFDFPLQFQPAHRYQVTVEPLELSGGIYKNPDNSVKQTAKFRAGTGTTSLYDFQLFSCSRKLSDMRHSRDACIEPIGVPKFLFKVLVCFRSNVWLTGSISRFWFGFDDVYNAAFVVRMKN